MMGENQNPQHHWVLEGLDDLSLDVFGTALKNECQVDHPFENCLGVKHVKHVNVDESVGMRNLAGHPRQWS